MKVLDVVIPGQPVGKGRPKFVRATGRAYTPKGTAEWERSAAYGANAPRHSADR